MDILIVDGQGGGIGSGIIEKLKEKQLKDCTMIAVGTNSMATANMLKAGATAGATGENAMVYNAENASIITGPMGIILPYAMLGEITEKMAMAIAGANAIKFLIPMPQASIKVVGIENKPLSSYIAQVAAEIAQYCNA